MDQATRALRIPQPTTQAAQAAEAGTGASVRNGPSRTGRTDGADQPSRPTVLLVEDERDFREVVSLRLQQQGYDVIEAGSAGTGWTLARSRPLEAAVVDYRLPGIDGQSLAYLLRHEFGAGLLLLGFTAWPVDLLARADVFDSVHEKPDVDAVLSSLRGLASRHASGADAEPGVTPRSEREPESRG